jgi:hypothetical protein
VRGQQLIYRYGRKSRIGRWAVCSIPVLRDGIAEGDKRAYGFAFRRDGVSGIAVTVRSGVRN